MELPQFNYCSPSGRFSFERVNIVNIHGMMFSCSGNSFVNIANLTVSDSFFSSHGKRSLMEFRNTSMHITRISFRGNTSQGYPTTVQGAFLKSESSNITIRKCSFTNGTAREGGVIYATLNSNLDLVKCIFSGNKAMKGGVLFISSGSLVDIIESSFTNSTALIRQGGAVSIEHSNEHCTARQ